MRICPVHHRLQRDSAAAVGLTSRSSTWLRTLTFFANLILWRESTVNRYASFRPFLPLWVNASTRWFGRSSAGLGAALDLPHGLLVKIPTGYRIRSAR
jgi:hypothetical protein